MFAMLLVALPAMAADINQSVWSQTDASNNAAPPAGWPAGMAPNQVEPTARAMMGATKRWYDRVNATATSGGSANALTLSYTVAPASLVRGDTYRFTAAASNTSAATLNINSLGAKAIQKTGVALDGGEIVAGRFYEVVYDGTQFQLNPVSGVNGPTSATVPFPATFGSFPTTVSSITVGTAVPSTLLVPSGASNGMTVYQTVPATYTTAPWPNTNYSAYMVSGNPTSSGSAVGYFATGGLAGTSSPNGNLVAFNSVLANNLYINGANGSGIDFENIIGFEADMNIKKKFSTAPVGTVQGFLAIGDSETGLPGTASNFSAGYRVDMLGLTAHIPWTYGLMTTDGSTVTGIRLGTLATGNSTASQPILLTGRDSGGTARDGTIKTLANGVLQLSSLTATWQLVPGGGLEVVTHQSLATGISVSAADTTMTSSVPLELLASQYAINGGGDVGINTGAGTPAAKLDVNGTFRAQDTSMLAGVTVGGMFKVTSPTPAIGSGFGTSPAIAGSNAAGRITVGTGGASSGVVTFGSGGFPAGAPACSAQDETTANAMRATATTTQLTITGTMVAADKITFQCIAYI